MKDIETFEGIEELKDKIIGIIEEYEDRYHVRIHLSEFKYDDLNDKKDFNIIVFRSSKVRYRKEE